jgi:hypothetical protein
MIVGWVTGRLVEGPERTNVPCRRSHGRTPRLGEIEAWLLEDTQEIAWRCPVCGDNGIISHWEGTHWDRSIDAVEGKSKPETPPAQRSQPPAYGPLTLFTCFYATPMGRVTGATARRRS